MSFWIPVAAGSVIVLLWMLLPLLRSRGAVGERRASYDMQVFKDQLKEIDGDLTRGVLSEAEAERSRTEISRRLLGAANAEKLEAGTGSAPRAANLVLAAVIALGVGFGGLALYYKIGAPGQRDFPLAANIAAQESQVADRPTQAQIEDIVKAREESGDLPLPDFSGQSEQALDLIEQLKTAMETRPDELQGHRLLAATLAEIGKFRESRAAQDQVMRILGVQAEATDYIDHAEIMIYAANGYVSPEAFSALDAAYRLSPEDPRMMFYIGQALAQEGQYEQTYGIWASLLERGPEDAPWIPAIRSQIDAIAEAAGITAQPRGPSAADVEAASDMSDDERQAMIAGMIAGLDERLSTEGGPIEDWTRLIGVYGVTGEIDKARDIWQKSVLAFADSPDDLALLAQAAQDAGLTGE